MVKRWVGAISRIILGLVFIVAGVAKAIDLNYFYYQLKAYPLGLPDPVVLLMARVFISFEIILGVALLINFLPRWTLSITFAILVLFLATTGWAAVGGFSEECGCFGKLVKRSPVEALIEDFVLLILAIMAVKFVSSGALTNKFKGTLVGLAVIIGAGLPYLFPETRPKVFAREGVGSYVGDLKPDGLSVEFAKGDYLLALIETDCEHCQGALPRLNELAQSRSVPKLVGICPNTQQEMDSLKVKMPVDFPVGFVPVRKFLLMNPEVPALLWVKEGIVRHSWPIDSTPTVPRMMEVLREGGAITTKPGT